jgi:hypothetical protein
MGNRPEWLVIDCAQMLGAIGADQYMVAPASWVRVRPP